MQESQRSPPLPTHHSTYRIFSLRSLLENVSIGFRSNLTIRSFYWQLTFGKGGNISKGSNNSETARFHQRNQCVCRRVTYFTNPLLSRGHLTFFSRFLEQRSTSINFFSNSARVHHESPLSLSSSPHSSSLYLDRNSGRPGLSQIYRNN